MIIEYQKSKDSLLEPKKIEPGYIRTTAENYKKHGISNKPEFTNDPLEFLCKKQYALTDELKACLRNK